MGCMEFVKRIKRLRTMIISEEPKCSDRGRYTTMQTCRILGVHRNTLKRYADSGKLKTRWRKCDRRKVFLGEDIKHFWRAQLC